jgi:hypothetical protein
MITLFITRRPVNKEQLKKIQDNMYDAEALLVYEELGCLREYKRSLREAEEVNNPGDAPDKDVSPEERSSRNFFTNFAVNARRMITALNNEFDKGDFFTIAFMCKATKVAPITTQPPALPPPAGTAVSASVEYKNNMLTEADEVTRNSMKYYACIFPKLDTKFIKSDIEDPASLKLVTPKNYFSELKLLSKKVDSVLTRYKLKTFGDMGSELKFEIKDLTVATVVGSSNIDRNVCKYHVASFENKVTVTQQNKTVGGKVLDVISGQGQGADTQRNDFAINISYYGISGILNLEKLFGDFFQRNFVKSLTKIELKDSVYEEEPGISFPTFNNFQEELSVPQYGSKTLNPQAADFFNTFNDIYFFYYLTKLKALNKTFDLDYPSLEIILTGKNTQSTGILYKIMIPKTTVSRGWDESDMNNYETVKSRLPSKRDADEIVVHERTSGLSSATRLAYSKAKVMEDTLRAGNLDDEDMLFIPKSHYGSRFASVQAEMNKINAELKHDVFLKKYGELLPRCIVVELADKRSLPKALLDKLKRGAAGALGNFLKGALEKGASYR